MLNSKSKARTALIKDMKSTDFSLSHTSSMGPDASSSHERVFSAFDEFLDRMPSWIFHTLGTIAALGAVWFALAYLGGLPRGIVELITLAMVGGFAYAVGFMVPLVVTYLAETRNRTMLALAVIGGGAVFGAMTISLAL